MKPYNVFLCVGNLTPEVKQSCEQKQIKIIEQDIGNVRNVLMLNELGEELIHNNNIFISNAQIFITKKLYFCLINELESRLRSLTPFINCRLIIHKNIDEYSRDEQLWMKRIHYPSISLNDFNTKTLNQIIPEYKNKNDMDKINAIAPCFYYYGIQDVLPIVYDELQNIKDKEYKSTHINKWRVEFDNSFSALTENDLYLLLRKIEEKYKDFDDIILRKSAQMKNEFTESYKSKLYADGLPRCLHLKHAQTKDDQIRFKIIIEEEGKRSTYYSSAGGFFVPWKT